MKTIISSAMLCQLLFVGFASAVEDNRSDKVDKKPNIILVMTDDQGYGDLACHGHPFINTPHLDKLYAQGTRFTDFHASPTCSPARAALMSGRAAFKNGVTHTILERERMALSATTIAEVLKSAGYTTGIFGKWHLGDADAYQPDSRGFDEVFIHGAGGIGQNYPGTIADAPPNRKNKYYDPVIKHNKTFVKTKGYCTDVFFQQALTWIKQSKEKPFFAYISTNAPHEPFIVPDKYKALYKGKCPDKSAAFFGMITNIDENMGLLMKKLDEWDLTNDTLLIFMTDNGSAAGTFNYGMKGKKGSVNEGGSRVPLFLRLPGKIKAGADVDRLTRHYDLFPTLAEFAGAAWPKDYKIDGQSLVPLIKNPKANWQDRYTFFHKGRWAKEGNKGWWGRGNHDPDKAKYINFAVRNERWRLVGKDELYDIDNDPGEQNNVAKANPEVVKEMLNAYDAWWVEVRPMMVHENVQIGSEKPFIDQYEKQLKEKGIPAWEPQF